MVSKTCQRAAALKREITALLQAETVTDAADLWTQGPTFVFLQNEIWQVLLLSGTESTTPRRLEVLLLEVFNLDRFLV